jgi:LacI family transcriptional regulator
MPGMANLRAIASTLGISLATVARALRGSSLVRPETRQRVEEAARKLGYCPDPMVTVLMERIRSGKEPHDQGSIAILIDAESAADWRRCAEPYQLQFDGYLSGAQHHGYRTECFYLQEKGLGSEAIDRILYARGFLGVIIAAPCPLQEKSNLSLKWDRYAVATSGPNWSHLAIDRACADFRYNVSLAFKKLVGRGYERIGFVLPPSALNPKDRNWLAGYLASQFSLPKARQLPVFIGSIHSCSVNKFRRWRDRWKPDALLCLLGEELEWMNQIGISPLEDMALVCLNRPVKSEFSGVEENSFLVGKLACDIVVNRIIHNERGLTDLPRRLLVPGTWVDGKTLPAQKLK